MECLQRAEGEIEDAVCAPAEGEIEDVVRAPAEGEIEDVVRAPADGEIEGVTHAPAEGEIEDVVRAPADGEIEDVVRALADGRIEDVTHAPREEIEEVLRVPAELGSARSREDRSAVVSTRELDAFASMIIAALPFPPLPLMASVGTESATASSFDLLKQAIVLQKLMGTHRPVELIVENKQRQLRALQQEMIAHCSSGKLDSDEWLEGAYELYCTHFRAYFTENYATCSRDLRFEPLQSVPARGVIMQQGLSHASAGLIMAGEDADGLSFARYQHLVAYYARGLGTPPENHAMSS